MIAGAKRNPAAPMRILESLYRRASVPEYLAEWDRPKVDAGWAQSQVPSLTKESFRRSGLAWVIDMDACGCAKWLSSS